MHPFAGQFESNRTLVLGAMLVVLGLGSGYALLATGFLLLGIW